MNNNKTNNHDNSNYTMGGGYTYAIMGIVLGLVFVFFLLAIVILGAMS